jgi:G8 domain
MPPSPPPPVSLPPVGTGSLWSDPATWGGTLPPAGVAVVIPAGKTVVLDTQTPALKGLTIEGTLAAADTDISITSDFVYVKGGRLQIGTAAKPYTKRATITLTGNTTAENPATPGFGNKVLAAMGGTVELHGQPVAKSWTRLTADLAAGQRTLALAEAPGWQAGDQVVLATASRDQSHYSLGEIESINGQSITLKAGTRYAHIGQRQQVAPDIAVDTRSAIGLLTRNIVIQGDTNSYTSKVGGHAMFMTGTANTTVQIAGVEFRAMGQHNQLGRYPVHFHIMERGCSGCYIKDSTVRDSVQRGIVVHDSAVTVANNVIFNTVGHNVVVETETTEGAVIDGNFALVNALPNPLFTEPALKLQNDTQPSNFWIKSARNRITGNMAAGALDSGFMYDHVSNGPAHFKDNTAHAAMAKGIETEFPTTAAIMMIFARNGMEQDVISDSLAYNSDNGFWLEIYDEEAIGPDYTIRPLVADRITMMDNATGLFARGAGNKVTLNDAVYIRNNSRNQYGGLHVLNRPTFVGMTTLASGHDTDPAESQIIINNPRLVNSSQFTPDDMSFSVYNDDALFPRGMYVHGSQHWLAAPACAKHTFTNRVANDSAVFYRCPKMYTYTEIDVRSLAVPAQRTHETNYIVRSDGLRFKGLGYTDAGAGEFTHMGGLSGYAAFTDAGLSYQLETASTSGYAVRLSNVKQTAVYTEQHTVDVALPVNAPPSAVYRNGRSYDNSDAYGAANAMRAATSVAEWNANPLTTYLYDAAAKKVWIKASARWVTIKP